MKYKIKQYGRSFFFLFSITLRYYFRFLVQLLTLYES